MSAEERVGEASLSEPAGAVPELQRRARRDGQQVDAGPAAAALVELGERKHGQALDVVERFDALRDELAEVLAGDRAVGADVDDVVPFVAAALQVVDDLGDDALGDVGLAEPDLVGDQEPQRRVVVVEHPLERPDGGPPLEVLEVGEHRFAGRRGARSSCRAPAIATS